MTVSKYATVVSLTEQTTDRGMAVWGVEQAWLRAGEPVNMLIYAICKQKHQSAGFYTRLQLRTEEILLRITST